VILIPFFKLYFLSSDITLISQGIK